MDLKVFGRTGRKISSIGMGTYYDPAWIATAFLGWRRGTRTKIEAIKTGLGVGMTLIDTAEIYQSEPLVAKAIQDWKREDLFIATKVWSNHLRRDDLFRSLDRSLRRLGVRYVDLYQVHFPNPRVPIAETMGAMEELVSQGKIASIGVSNFSFQQTQEANAALRKSQLASVQVRYSLMDRAIESAILPYCDKEGIGVLAYYPLGHGKLIRDSRLDESAKRYGKSRAQISLNWLASKPSVFPIPRASSESHVKENRGAAGWGIDPEDIGKLDSAFGL
ncbi:MAG: aldo/keto reductase [Thaumarchaeota archaeon]|nr:aldo/keto reductase [Nitrososphaerota archaeon]